MRRLALLALAACHGTPSGHSSSCDTSTDDGVRAAYQKATGKTLPEKSKWECIDRSYNFPKAVSIGSFADDRGCMYEGILYGCTFATAKDLQKQMFADSGWDKADHAAREKLIVDFWSDFYETSAIPNGDNFPAGHTFTAPAFEWADDGSATYTYWHGQSHGMTCGTHYYRVEDHVNADGTLGESKALEDFDQGC